VDIEKELLFMIRFVFAGFVASGNCRPCEFSGQWGFFVVVVVVVDAGYFGRCCCKFGGNRGSFLVDLFVRPPQCSGVMVPFSSFFLELWSVREHYNYSTLFLRKESGRKSLLQ
jgi:hypothetical protein